MVRLPNLSESDHPMLSYGRPDKWKKANPLAVQFLAILPQSGGAGGTEGR